MAHLLCPQKANIDIPLFFNVDAVVGANPASNLREDVLLVQFLMVAQAPKLQRDLDLKAAFSLVNITGVMDSPTLNAIMVQQRSLEKQGRKGGIDGRVSPAKGYSFGGGIYSIVVLNESVQHFFIDVWPRIDKIPGFPAELKNLVVRTVQGT